MTIRFALSVGGLRCPLPPRKSCAAAHGCCLPPLPVEAAHKWRESPRRTCRWRGGTSVLASAGHGGGLNVKKRAVCTAENRVYGTERDFARKYRSHGCAAHNLLALCRL